MNFLRTRWIGALLPAALCAAIAPAAARAQVTGAEVRDAIAKGVKFLRATQQHDGRWPDYQMQGGTTAMATLALLHAGAAPDTLKSALSACWRIPLERTYVVSLKIQALAAADPKRYHAEIAAAADWLLRAQNQHGMWGYDIATRERGDFSNTQFALLGLHEAGQAGVKIREPVWRLAESAWVRSQHKDGGWGYVPSFGEFNLGSTESMTAAGVASLYIVGNSLQTRAESGFTAQGSAPRCGLYAEYRPLARGIHWLGQNFQKAASPWYYYVLYGLERVGIFSGLRYFGKHDWYREGAAELIKRQAADGSWRQINPIVDTSFALLFLAKGHRPVLIHKLQWSTDNRWNLDRNDLAHLTAFIGDRLGEPVSWEVVPLTADLKEWLSAPILYFNGHTFPKFKEAEIAKLRDFVAQGGTILAEACCGRKEFTEGMKALVNQAWPDYELRPLPPDHPVFNTLFRIDGDGERVLMGLDVACRTSVFFSPQDLSCLWEQARIRVKSEAAFQLGANIAAYATGMEPLPDKLETVRLAAGGEKPTATQPATRDAVFIAQLMHNGDWRPDAHAIAHLSEFLHEKMGVDVVPSSLALRATDPKLAQHPIVYMTGHFSFKLSAEEVAALRQHLSRGGFLFADACCGRRPFDVSFRELAAELFPDQPLQRLPATHPVIAGAPGVPLPEVAYKTALQREQPSLKSVVLEGLRIDARTALVYSPYGLGCGLDGHACFACRGLAPKDAMQLAANIVLYALSY